MKKKISVAIEEELIVLLARLKGTTSRSAIIESAIRAYLRTVLHQEGVG